MRGAEGKEHGRAGSREGRSGEVTPARGPHDRNQKKAVPPLHGTHSALPGLLSAWERILSWFLLPLLRAQEPVILKAESAHVDACGEAGGVLVFRRSRRHLISVS